MTLKMNMLKKKISVEQPFKTMLKFVQFVSKNGRIQDIIDLLPLNVVIYSEKGLSCQMLVFIFSHEDLRSFVVV